MARIRPEGSRKERRLLPVRLLRAEHGMTATSKPTVSASKSEATPRSCGLIFTCGKMKITTSPLFYKGATLCMPKKLGNLQGAKNSIIFAMKDWKTYAIIILAAWCVFLTCKKSCQDTTPSADIGTPIDCADTPPVWSNNLQHVEWAQGGENGLLLDCYCRIMPMSPTSAYSKLQRCRLTFSKDGLLVKSELLPESVRLTANCRADRSRPQRTPEEFERLNVIRNGLIKQRESAMQQSDSTASKIQ